MEKVEGLEVSNFIVDDVVLILYSNIQFSNINLIYRSVCVNESTSWSCHERGRATLWKNSKQDSKNLPPPLNHPGK
jgi:hypothetical protein